MERKVSELTEQRDELTEKVQLLEAAKKELEEQLQDYTEETSQQVCKGAWLICVGVSSRVRDRVRDG